MSKHKTDAHAAAKAAAKDTKGVVHLFVLMDETGSMAGLEESVVTGCNEFLHAFRENPKARVWLATFDAHPGEPRTRFRFTGVKATSVRDLAPHDYNPRGMTPLNDAVMDTIDALDKSVEKGDGVFVAIITDGRENASETKAETVAAAVAKREKRGWGFVYLGAGHDAAVAAAQIGLAKKGQALNFNATAGGVKATSSALRGMAATYDSAGQDSLYASASALHDATGGKLADEDEDDGDVAP